MRRVLIAAVLLGGCTIIGPDYEEPSTEGYTDGAFLESEGYASEAPLSDWWTAFDDESLDAFVALAIAQNNELGAALANVNAARAQVGLRRLDRLPFDTITSVYNVQRQSATTLAAGFGDEGGFDIGDELLPTIDIFSISAAASWEVDLWGRITRGINVAEARFGEAQAQLADLQTIVIAETVDAYIGLRGTQEQLDVARENARNQRETVKLVTARRDAGRGTDLDVERAQSQLAVTLAAIPPLEAAVAQERYRLGVLVGETPARIAAMTQENRPLPSIERALPVGDMSALLERRPDIRAAERSLAAATEEIGLQMTSAFPRVQLLGGIGVQSVEFENTFTEQAINFSYGPSITWSLTDLLRFRQTVRAASARAEGAFDTYEQTILSALAETETALASQRAAQRQLVALAEAERASTAAARLARLRFENGASDFLAVLDAERRQLEAATDLAAARIGTARAQITVFRTLRAGPGLMVAEAQPERERPR
ncbi:efflux transporter outer membrane subunit [Parvularcula maris]|uniref:Efflux transporter outer membrane subunit n=1 Tax=Parvularcula maris TaxID=2965077 RepID=A0A9X2L7G3_9PROT|nr:efflux transporter outer membrane subunit [Parvularcula maris]MCQ8184491.1 efflux transporter outer membrane subunit [Parvularcula maris]